MEHFKIIRESFVNKFLSKRYFLQFILSGIGGFSVTYVWFLLSKAFDSPNVLNFIVAKWLDVFKEHLDAELLLSMIAMTVDFYHFRKQFAMEVNRLFSHNKSIDSTKNGALKIIDVLNHLSEEILDSEKDSKKVERIIHKMVPFLDYSELIIKHEIPVTEFRSDLVNFMYASEGLVAITTSEPLAWLDPSFYFYLINNGVVNFKWTNSPLCKNQCPPTTQIKKPDIHICNNRGEPPFTSFLNAKAKILTDMSNGIIPERNTVRFMIIEERQFSDLQYYLSCFQAIHEIFGKHLILIEKNWFFKEYANIFDQVKGMLAYDKEGFDIAVTILDSDFKNIFFVDNDGLLTNKPKIAEISELIKKMSSIVIDPNNQSHILTPMPLNDNNCLIKVQ